MAHTVASSSTAASPKKLYHVFINHRGPAVKKTFASHLYHRLSSPYVGLRVFLDRPELRVGDKFPDQIKEAIKTASVHVAIFSKAYAESVWCLNELLYMFESGAPIIPVFYDVEPAQLRDKDEVYAKALHILESKKTTDSQTMEEKPRQSSTTIQKWKEALSRVADISGLDLQKTCNGDEGDLVEKIVQRVLEEIKSILSVGTSEFYCSEMYGGPGGAYRSDGTYSGIKQITTTVVNDNLLTSVQLQYGLEGDESLKERYLAGARYGRGGGAPTEVFYRSQLYGGHGRDYWNDGTYSGIKRITMTAKDNSLTSVQLHYALEGDESGKDIFIFGLRHGRADGAPIEYNLNYPQEIVTKISGYFGSYKSWPLVIKSLTLHTNQRKLGPCGQEQGTYFETEEGGKIVGVFGSGGTVVNSIGVYMLKPRASKNQVSKTDSQNKSDQICQSS